MLHIRDTCIEFFKNEDTRKNVKEMQELEQWQPGKHDKGKNKLVERLQKMPTKHAKQTHDRKHADTFLDLQILKQVNMQTKHGTLPSQAR